MMKRIVCIMGPSGSGKTSVVRKYCQLYGGNDVISHTTRLKREGEIEGVDYYYITPEEYLDIDFVEKVHYNKALYGLSRQEVERKLEQPETTFAVVTWDGYLHLKEEYPVFPIYLNVEEDVQHDRLVRRGDKKQKIAERMKLREADQSYIDQVDDDGGYIVDANGTIDETVERIREIILSLK